MPYLTMDQPEFWQPPDRLSKVQRIRREFVATAGPGERAAADNIAGMRTVQIPLGDAEDDSTPIANFVDFPPFFPLPRHAHNCEVAMIIIRGSMYADGRILHPGDRMTAHAHEFYGPELAGPEGCTRMEFFASMSGLLQVIYQKATGEIFTTDNLNGAAIVEPRELMGHDELRAMYKTARTAAAQRDAEPAG